MVGKTGKEDFIRRKRKSSHEGPYHVVRKMVFRVFSVTEAGEQQIGWVPEKDQATVGAVGKACQMPNVHAKIDSTITKYIGHNFTTVTTFIIIIIRNNFKNCYHGKIRFTRCQHRTHHNRTPPY